ncbi:hypothetical protein P8452_23007 [Trifolium repens]|nr:hypothetical protein P8452_23007 [Trifolium repens]
MPSQDQAHGSEVEHGDEANVAEAEANVAEVGENVAEDVENVGEDEENVAEDVAEDEDGDDDGQAPVVPEEGYGGGYMSLLQGWVISHMPRMSVWKLATNWKETLPYNAKFENMVVLTFDVAFAAFV